MTDPRLALLHRYDLLLDLAAEQGAYGPLRLDGVAAYDALTGAPVRYEPGWAIVRDELLESYVVINSLRELLAKVGCAAAAGRAETFEQLERLALEAIARGSVENGRQRVLDCCRSRIEAFVEYARVSAPHPLTEGAVHRLVQDAKEAACDGDERRCDERLAKARALFDGERDSLTGGRVQ